MGRHTVVRQKRHRRAAIAPYIVGICLLGIVALGVSFAAVTGPLQGGDGASTRGGAVAAEVRRTLVIEVTGAECRVFVRRPGGEILLGELLDQGRIVQFDEPELSVVISDAGAVKVRVNGVPRPTGAPGARDAFTAVKNQ